MCPFGYKKKKLDLIQYKLIKSADIGQWAQQFYRSRTTLRRVKGVPGLG